MAFAFGASALAAVGASALAAVAPAASRLPATANAQASTGAITGTVTSAAGKPIEGAEVCAYPSSLFSAGPEGSEPPEEPGSPPQCAKTSASGSYTLAGLAAGQYVVEFNGSLCPVPAEAPPGPEGPPPECVPVYVTEYYNGHEQPTEGDPVTVSAGATTEHIDASLSETGRIAGRVTSAATGAPLAGVEACTTPAEGISLTLVLGLRCATTGGSGEYTIAGLGPGSYRVGFSDYACTGEVCGSAYVTQYYDDKPTLESADPVAVTAGQTTTGIDAALVEGGRIEGKVTSAATGAAIKGAIVCTLDPSGGAEAGGGCTLTDASGEYTIGGLASATYKVRFADISCSRTTEKCTRLYQTQFYDDKPTLESADPVAVRAPSTTSGIDAKLVPAAPGTPAGAPLPGASGRPSPGGGVGGAWVVGRRLVMRRGIVSLALRCASAHVCKGVVTLLAQVTERRRRSEAHAHGGRRKHARGSRGARHAGGHTGTSTRTVVIGRARFTIRPGVTSVLRVRLTRRGRALVRRAGRRGLPVSVAGSGLASTLALRLHARGSAGSATGRRHRG